jgi:hypothetical protein
MIQQHQALLEDLKSAEAKTRALAERGANLDAILGNVRQAVLRIEDRLRQYQRADASAPAPRPKKAKKVPQEGGSPAA